MKALIFTLRTLIWSCLLSIPLLLQSQSALFQKLDVGGEQRFMAVYSMAQSKDRLMYIGTNNGLFCYNGISFTQHKMADSLATSSISAMAFWKDKLWAGNTEGQLIVCEGDTCQLWTDGPEISASISGMLAVGDILFVATYGDGVYALSEDSVRHFTAANGLGDNYTYDIRWHDERVWIGTDGGLSEINYLNFNSFLYDNKNGLSDNIVRSLCSLNDSLLAVGTYEKGVFVFNTNNYRFEPLLQDSLHWSKGAVEDMLLNGSKLWVATLDQGVLSVDMSAPKHHRSIRQYRSSDGLGSANVQCILADQERNVWLGSKKGVFLHVGSQFEYLSLDRAGMGTSVFDVLIDRQGNTWLATDLGVFKLRYETDSSPSQEMILKSGGSLGLQVVSLFERSDGQIFMGSYGSGVYHYDPESGQLHNYGKREGLQNENVLDIAEDQQGRLWLATLGGCVARLETRNGTPEFEHLNDTNYLASKYIYTTYIDPNNHLWIGSDGAGVSRYDCSQERFLDAADGQLRDYTVYSITQDGLGNMWFSTAKSGLLRWNGEGVQRYGENQGVQGEVVEALITGGNGEVMAIHNEGIDVYSPKQGEFTSYAFANQETRLEPNLNAAFLDGGQVWIGATAAAIRFEYEKQREEAVSPKVLLSGLKVLYEPTDLSRSEFAYDENHFVFNYLGIWMKASDDVRYKYWLEGFDKQWSYPTEARVAIYSSLPPGKYTFRVIASAGNRDWSNGSECSYSFEVKRPFWSEWWFIVLAIIVTTGSLVWIAMYRTRKLRADKRRLAFQVSKRTEQLFEQKNIIETKNKEILASINYAKRIQTAILPTSGFIQENLPDSFVLYKPKDIVAGDFYWLVREDPFAYVANDLDDPELKQRAAEQSKKTSEVSIDVPKGVLLLAAADCTGHGVPGAMVSVICHNALNRSVREYGLVSPSDILDKVNEIVAEQFTPSDIEVKDGMDIALCALSQSSEPGEEGSVTLEYAGAHNPLWLVTERKLPEEMYDNRQEHNGAYLYEFKPDKQPIGAYIERQRFTNHKIRLEKGDQFYLLTDGFADQFGGEFGKKFKYRPLKELILSVRALDMKEQRRKLDRKFESWRGYQEQVDDVCVIGVRI